MYQKTDRTLEPTTADIDRFWTKVDRRGPDDCWPWIAGRDALGYGHFFIFRKGARRGLRASRVAYAISAGAAPSELFVCHECDNPPCCNPAHLYAGTSDDNIADKLLRNRQSKGDTSGARLHPERICRGETSGTSKLKEHQVLQIRALAQDGTLSFSKIGNLFGVSRRAVGLIASKKRWKHL